MAKKTRGQGRPKSAEPLVQVTTYLRPDQIAWLSIYTQEKAAKQRQAANRNEAIRQAVDLFIEYQSLTSTDTGAAPKEAIGANTT